MCCYKNEEKKTNNFFHSPYQAMSPSNYRLQMSVNSCHEQHPPRSLKHTVDTVTLFWKMEKYAQ